MGFRKNKKPSKGEELPQLVEKSTRERAGEGSKQQPIRLYGGESERRTPKKREGKTVRFLKSLKRRQGDDIGLCSNPFN